MHASMRLSAGLYWSICLQKEGIHLLPPCVLGDGNLAEDASAKCERLIKLSKEGVQIVWYFVHAT